MEHAPFSAGGLDSEQLEKEIPLVEKSIHAVQEAIKEIDFSKIDDIVIDMLAAVRTELSREQIKEYYSLKGSYSIKVTYSGEVDVEEAFTLGKYAPAAYSHFPDIVVHAREIVDEKGDFSKERKQYLLKVVAHEIMHHFGFKVEQQEGKDIPLVHAGLSFGEPDKEGYVDDVAFSLLDEAMTEILADAVSSEYLARTGTIKDYEDSKNWYQKPLHVSRHATYIPERMMLLSFVEKIAQYSGLSEDDVYRALAVEYFTGGNISRAEIVDELKDEPAIVNMIHDMKENQPGTFSDMSDDEQENIVAFLDLKQLHWVKAFFDRDYIGTTNQERQDKKRFFNVLR